MPGRAVRACRRVFQAFFGPDLTIWKIIQKFLQQNSHCSVQLLKKYSQRKQKVLKVNEILVKRVLSAQLVEPRCWPKKLSDAEFLVAAFLEKSQL